MSIDQNVSSSQAGQIANGFFAIYSPDEFKYQPETAWLIDDILPSAGLASVYGPSGVGKSFICLDMVASVASGQPWFGHRVKQARVAYLPLEGRGGFPRRMKAWEADRGVSLPEDMVFLRELVAFDICEHAKELAEAIVKSGGAELIIIDTLNKSSPGADENSSSDMGKIIQGAMLLQELTGGLVLLIHHPGKDGSRGLRGHSSLHAALDAIIEIRKDGELIRWTLVKSKDGEDGINHAFRLLPVEIGIDESGKALKSCVVQEVEGAVAPVTQSQPQGTNQKLVLGAAREILNQRRMEFVAGLGGAEGFPFDALQVELKDVLVDIDSKHRKSRTKEALQALIRQGYLVVKDDLVCLPAND